MKLSLSVRIAEAPGSKEENDSLLCRDRRTCKSDRLSRCLYARITGWDTDTA